MSRRSLRAVLLVAAAVAGITACRNRSASAIDSLREAAATHPTRFVEGRLTMLDAYRPAARRRSGSASASPGELELQAAALEVLRSARGPTSEDVRSRAAASLVLGNATNAIAELRKGPQDDARVQSDLAGALLDESGRAARLELAVDAIAAADRALASDPQLAEAAFNRALALERLGLSTEAREAWRRYLVLDRGTSWRAEASAAVQRLEVRNAQEQWKSGLAQLERDAAAGNGSGLADAARRFPQFARTWGEGIYLARWADGEESALGVARALGEALHQRNGETLLRDAVAAIETADATRRTKLAAAHRMYRDARIALRDHQLADAESKLIAAETAFAASGSPMHLLARYFRGSVLYEAGRIDEAGQLLDRLAASAPETRGYRALAAQIGWERGLCRMQRGDLTEAQQIFLASQRILDALGERDLQATFDLLLAHHAEYAGETEEAWRQRVRALAAHSAAGNDYRVAVSLLSAASARIRRDEWSRAAALAGIASAMAARLDEPVIASQALLFAGRAAAEQNDPKGAATDLAAADRWIARLKDARQRTRLEAERSLTAAASLRATDPRGAVAELDRCILFYRQSGFAILLPRPYLERARAQRAAGDFDAARRDLESGIEIVERNREAIADLEQRAAFLAVGHALFAEAADLALSQGDAQAALFAVERGRARAILDAFGPAQAARTPLLTAELQDALAVDAAIVVFAELKDRVVALVVRRDGVDVVETPRRDGMGPADPDRRAMLPSAFLDGIERLLAGARTVAIVGDPALHREPEKRLTAALLGDRLLIASPSATLAVESSRTSQPVDGTAALIVAASVFDRDPAGTTEPLLHVAAEARTVEGIWPGSRVLTGGQATRAAFVREGASASLIHFAGHGVHRTILPSDARLLLAREGKDRGSITAGEIARLRFPSTRLVVLNACRTAASSNRADGVMNLATAFRMAGVPNVIAAAGDVDDATAAEFAALLHRHLRAGLPPAAALREVLREETARLGRAEAVLRYGGFSVLGGSTTLVRPDRAEMQRRAMR